jgi:ApaG protein
MSEANTRGVVVTVRPDYLEHQSDPRNGVWMFAYHVRITNQGDDTVQLVSRHWIITDATGRVEEVRGAGVVGEQPVLEPGKTFEYTSGCPLPTPMGTMHGTYQMITRKGERFDAEIAPFTLAEPYSVN